jgi:PASTA domain-containing protein
VGTSCRASDGQNKFESMRPSRPYTDEQKGRCTETAVVALPLGVRPGRGLGDGRKRQECTIRDFALAVVSGLVLGACASAGTLSSPTGPGTPQGLSPSSPSGVYPSPDESAPGLVKVPSLVGLALAEAKSRLRARGLAWTVKKTVTSTAAPGKVLSASPKKGQRVAPGTVIALVVAKAPPPATQPPPSDCDPHYVGVCLKDDIGDYDCAGGSGNGPNYAEGPFQVVGGDPFGLDADGDGVGCE